MRFQRIIELTYFRPWLITVEGWQAVNSIVEAHVLRELAARPDKGVFNEPLAKMSIERGVATIPIHGTIVRRASMLAKQCGATDTLDVSSDLRGAMADASVSSIILDISSPGGGVEGVAELANEVARAAKSKNVVAWSGDEMASAAYWIGSGATSVVTAPSAQVGSIGVFMAALDKSEAYKQQGLRVDLIKAGKYKAMGYPGTTLTDEQRDFLQARVDATHETFKSFVKDNRKSAKASAMEGQLFGGKEAIKAGLVTASAESLIEIQDYLATS